MAVKEAREAQSAWEDPLRGGQGKRHPIILQQSVTMLAYMDKNNASAQKTPTSFWDSMGVTHSRDLPILVGAATGAIGLIVIILTAVVIWHCCTRNGSNDKAYVVENLSRSSSVSRPATSNMVQSDSVIFLSAKSRRPTGSRMDEASPSTEAADTMSQLHSVHISHRGGVSDFHLIAMEAVCKGKDGSYMKSIMPHYDKEGENFVWTCRHVFFSAWCMDIQALHFMERDR